MGFSTVFVLVGLTASLLGRVMQEISPWLAKIGGVVVVLFGLHMTGILRIPFLEYDLRPQSRSINGVGMHPSFDGRVFFGGLVAMHGASAWCYFDDGVECG